MLIASKNQALLFECFAKALEAKIGKYTPAHLISLLFWDLLASFNPLDLNTMTFFHQLLGCFAFEKISLVDFGAIITSCLFIIYFCLHGHSDTTLYNRVKENEELVARQGFILEQLAAYLV